ncbi:MAG: outer membrane beta-barrel protein [Acidobacteriia bacterium]|nr:outer membrane beta-barrel protein [Terriglobia bacterium]
MRGLTITLLCLPFLPAPEALAQGVQNSDFSLLAGAPLGHPVDPSGSQLHGLGAWNYQMTYGYQILQRSLGSVWLEVPMTFLTASGTAEDLGASVDNDFFCITPGVRYQIPLNRRLSIYGAAGGGYGYFREYEPVSGSPLHTKNSHHGVFDFGGGVDVRLSRSLSVRTEVRDFVSGQGLSGAAGRQHVIWVVGIAFHH